MSEILQGKNPEALVRHEIEALQLARLQRTIVRSYEKIPHYARTYEAAGMHPRDLRGLSDLARFPFTTKDHLRAHYPFGMLAVPLNRLSRLHASSGTTGKSTVVGYTPQDIKTWAQLIARSLRAAGAHPGDRLHVAYGYGLFTGGLGLHYGAEEFGCTVIPMGGGQTERQVQLIEDFRPDIIAATPSYLLAIADEFERQGRDPISSSLRLAICGAEPWSEAIRDLIEGRLGLTALDHYGLSELMGPGVGQEFATREGPTLWEDHFLPEIIDPETGALLPDGMEGELVLTSLTKEAMPVIRYRTGDLTRLLPGTRSAMRRIARIRDRSDDMLIIRGVNVFPSQVHDVLITESRLSPRFLIEVSRPQNLDVFGVHVESRETVSVEEARSLEESATQKIKALLGISSIVRVLQPSALPPPIGKRVQVIDRRRATPP